MVGVSVSDADAPPSPAVPRLELGMSSESSFIWQKCKSNNSDGEKTGAKDTRSQLVGVVAGRGGGAYWGLEHLQRLHTAFLHRQK